MPANSKCRKKNDKREKKTGNKLKRPACDYDVPDSSNESFHLPGADCHDNSETISILGQQLDHTPCSLKSAIDDDTSSITSEALLCLEDVYDTCSPQHFDSLDMWVSDVSSASLVVGSGTDATDLRNQIVKLTSGQDVQHCSQEEAFEVCNNKSFIMIWMMVAIPVGQDILSLTTSIRYASKCNRGTVVIGVSSSPSNVDLRLHGIDEVIQIPVTDTCVRQKYSKWTSVDLVPEEIPEISDNSEPKDLSTPCSGPSTPSTPLTPSTPATPTSNHSNNSQFSVSSLDSGIESPGTPQMTTEPCNFQSIIQLPAQIRNLKHRSNSNSNSAADHTTKEKLRRERIKDSCDQLRVLLPYIRGRKTDMASILEMCVDYLKLVNAALPQEFQKQIIDMLGLDPVATAGNPRPRTVAAARKAKRLSQMTKSPSINTVSSSTSAAESESLCDSSQKKSESKTLNYCIGEPEPAVMKRDITNTSVDVNSSKRFCLQTDGCPQVSPVSLTSMPTLPSFENLKMPRPESSSLDQMSPSFPYHPIQVSHATGMTYGEYDTNSGRLFTSHDSFSPTSYFSTTVPSKLSGMDRNESFGVYLDTPSMYQYYGNSNIPPSFSLAPVPDYVNPNAVLPMSYNGNIKQEGQKYDDKISIAPSLTSISTPPLPESSLSGSS